MQTAPSMCTGIISYLVHFCLGYHLATSARFSYLAEALGVDTADLLED